MQLRRGLDLVVLLALAPLSCVEPAAPPAAVPVPPPTTPPVATARPTVPAPVPVAPPPASGTRVTLSDRKNNDSWDAMIVAGGRLWTLTDVNSWTTTPMYVPSARLWSVPITGGTELTKHFDLEGLATLAADDTMIYVAVRRDLSTMNTPRASAPTGRLFRVPLSGGGPLDMLTGIEPRTLAVDGDTLWLDGQRMPKDGSRPPTPSGVKFPLAFAFDDANVYYTSGKNAAEPAKPAGKNGRVIRMPKKGGAPTVIASDLPDEPAGIVVDATHVYVSAISWSPAGAERAGIVARVPKAGGPLEILAKDLVEIRGLWVSGDFAYTVSGKPGRPGSVLRIPKTGGAATAFVTDSTLAHVTMDATSIFFTSDGTFKMEPFERLTPPILVRVTK